MRDLFISGLGWNNVTRPKSGSPFSHIGQAKTLDVSVMKSEVILLMQTTKIE